mmetsp:Transcript_33584/g.73697  ORF Transcript_33584/g.73697 Transcript_33584/m.73697 type:complete len:277 (-) Transcript_33584:801-1631(-)
MKSRPENSVIAALKSEMGSIFGICPSPPRRNEPCWYFARMYPSRYSGVHVARSGLTPGLSCASSSALTASLPRRRMCASCASLQLSRRIDSTLLMCAPSLRWTPQQRIQRTTPRLVDAHIGASGEAETQSAQTSLPRTASSARCTVSPWRVRSALPSPHPATLSPEDTLPADALRSPTDARPAESRCGFRGVPCEGLRAGLFTGLWTEAWSWVCAAPCAGGRSRWRSFLPALSVRAGLPAESRRAPVIGGGGVSGGGGGGASFGSGVPRYSGEERG